MKIFLSSTAYDLGDIRAIAIERIRTSGHIPLYHEMPTFAKRRGLHSHDMCIHAVDDADAVLCIIDKRYGAFYAGDLRADFPPQSVWVRASKRNGDSEQILVAVPTDKLSVTWCELIRAYQQGKQVVTFARGRTLDEKQTRRRNQFVKSFAPAYADRNELFDLLDWITKRPIDNWIVPFNSAIDFDEKLRVWLEQLGGSTGGSSDTGPIGGPPTGVMPSGGPQPEMGMARPVTVVVEGMTDRLVVTEIVKVLGLPVRVDITISGGKVGMMQNIRKYLAAFRQSAAVVFLVDADTNADATIEATKHEFVERTRQVTTPPAFLCVATPQIEAWLMAAVNPAEYDKRRSIESPAGWKRGLDLTNAVHALGTNWELVQNLVPSFQEFVWTLKTAAQLAVTDRRNDEQ